MEQYIPLIQPRILAELFKSYEYYFYCNNIREISHVSIYFLILNCRHIFRPPISTILGVLKLKFN